MSLDLWPVVGNVVLPIFVSLTMFGALATAFYLTYVYWKDD